MKPQHIALHGADITLYPALWTAHESQQIFEQLQTLRWQQKAIRLFGRSVMQPRLVAWYGDDGADYVYSGVRNIPLPWEPTLLALRERVQRIVPHTFNAVLCNFYRDGNDSIGWHSDDEKSLGPQPIIASLSFGATRVFRLQHKRDKTQKLAIELPDASLLLMQGATQKNYRHAIFKTKDPIGPRVNLTFRNIVG